jgi:hypothetical protein
LWDKDISIRDNGGITIGCCIALINPKPIEDYLAGDIPLIDSDFSSIVLKKPTTFEEVSVDEGISQGVTRSFVLRNAMVDVLSSSPVQTQCSGLFCGKQDINNVLKSGRGCGCYSMQDRIGKIVMMHSIQVKDVATDLEFTMNEFSSYKFDSLFMNSPFPNSVNKQDLDMTEKFMEFEDLLDGIMNRYNARDGFTVIGWYKRGEIHDKSNKEEGVEVKNSEVMYHIVDIFPEASEVDAGIAHKFDPQTISNGM